jgi:pyruvate/2-oxoglutarate dehydrogenase complex dihydrolipoamide dehydrogenase (E3) component
VPRDERFDLVVLGGGTAGLVSAIIAARVGSRVALVEAERTGGDCLWTGCVPSKALIAAADLAHRMRHADRVGLPVHEPAVDFAAVMAHVHAARETIAPEDSPERLRSEGVTVVDERGAFAAPGVIAAGSRRLRYGAAIVATGSRPVLPPVPGLADAAPLTSDTVWDLEELPGRLVVLGGGPIGCELGQAFARLGSRVTIVEMGDRLLAAEEEAAGRLIADVLRGEGVDLRLGRAAESVAAGGGGAGVVRAGGEDLRFDRLLVVAGRTARTADLGLEVIGARVSGDGTIAVDERLRTTAPHVYAAGDVTGGPPFTHVAAQHARIAAPNALFGLRRRVEYAAVPWATFTDPEVGRVGLTEAQARERWGDRATVASFDYEHSDRAITAGQARGFAKLIGDPRGRLVGATVAAPSGGETIAALAAHVAAGAKIGAISSQVHAYPTLAEGPARAADQHVTEQLLRPGSRAALRVALGLVRLLRR